MPAKQIKINPTVSTDHVEREIKNMAISIINDVVARKVHPSYGYTKTSINAKYRRLEGMCALYAYISHQTLNAQGVTPSLVSFVDRDVKRVIEDAIKAVKSM